MKATRNVLTGLLLTIGLIAGMCFLHAQEVTFTQAGAASLTDTNVSWSSLSDFEVELKLIEATPTISAADLASQGLWGTFYSAQHISDWPPLPGDPLGLPVWEIDTNLFLINDLSYNYAASSAKSTEPASGMQTMNLAGGGTLGSLISYPSGSLWLQINGITNGTVYLTLNGTTNGVEYQILSQEALSNAPMSSWNAEGPLFLGSDTTNWTTTTVAQNGRTSLFLAARSWADSTGSGIPDWWLLKYFGTTDVNVNALDSVNDGWTIYQKFLMGLDPNAFFTPPAPSDLTVSFDSVSSMAEISWQPSLGPITGYTIQKDDQWTGQTTTFNFSQSVNSFPDTITDDQGEKITPPPVLFDLGPAILIQYQIQAHYPGGDSAWSAPVLLEPTYGSPNLIGGFLPVSLVAGLQGSAYLAAWGLPENTATLRVKLVDEYAEIYQGDSSFDTTVDIPVSSSTNGLYLLPNNLVAPPMDSYGRAQYRWFVQMIDAGNNPSEPAYFPLPYTSRAVPIYLDGRAQLKQNLIFQLRSAQVDTPFQFDDIYSTTTISTSFPVNYAFAGFYDNYNNGTFNALLPFVNNYTYRNFVFNTNDLSPGGILNSLTNYVTTSDFGLTEPAPYSFELPVNATNGTPIPSLLATNDTRWLGNGLDCVIYPGFYDNFYEIGMHYNSGNGTLIMEGGIQNLYGLAFLSTEAVQSSSQMTTLYPGNSASWSSWMYSEVVQPQFQIKEYDFWNPANSALPGSVNFSTTNQSQPFFITGVGSEMRIAGYAKLAVLNAYSGVYGYLGQYFDQAYTEGTNGMATTNSTGVLSSYGDFFPIQPGPAALVTMPDLDTGERGTCTVYAISLNVDANHDGAMDTSFSGPDYTSSAKPMEFWVNNGWDDQRGVDQPSYKGYTNYADGQIEWQRDLENFGRLWICGVPRLPSSQGYSVQLWWYPISGSPAINLFRSVETNGGIGYLTDTNVAAAQTVLTLPDGPGLEFGQVPSDGTFTFPDDFFDGTNKYFLFEGAGIGKGELVMTIYQNGNPIASASQWLDLHDIEDFYERAAISNNISGAISNWTSTVESWQPATANLCGNDTNLIIFVHGINVGNWNWRDDSDTVLKRLYWAGYQGKFASVKWPCNPIDFLTFLTLNVDDYNDSEIKAYKASTALAIYLTQLRSRFPAYHLNILAHSQGNAIVSEAIEEGAPFDTYILTQGAMPASCYDVDTATNATLLGRESYFRTPEWQPMGYHGVYTNLTGNIVDFFNPLDKALGYWFQAEEYFKPSIGYSYDGTNSTYTGMFSSYTVTDSQESRANVSRSRTLAIGQQAAQGIIRTTINLNTQFGFNGDSIDEHSAQWTRPIQTSLPYYNQILIQIRPIP